MSSNTLLTSVLASSLRQTCALPGSLENLPSNRPDHPFCFAPYDEDEEQKDPCQSLVAGITPLGTVTRYRETPNRPSRTHNTEKNPVSKDHPSRVFQISPTDTRTSVTTSPEPIPPAQTIPISPERSNGHKSSTELEVARRARPFLLPNLSPYERTKVLNSMRNAMLLEELCPPHLETAPKSNLRKRNRSPSPDANYRPSAVVDRVQPRRKSIRLTEDPSKGSGSEGVSLTSHPLPIAHISNQHSMEGMDSENLSASYPLLDPHDDDHSMDLASSSVAANSKFSSTMDNYSCVNLPLYL